MWTIHAPGACTDNSPKAPQANAVKTRKQPPALADDGRTKISEVNFNNQVKGVLSKAAEGDQDDALCKIIALSQTLH